MRERFYQLDAEGVTLGACVDAASAAAVSQFVLRSRPVLLVLLALSLPAAGQLHVDAGLAIGQQSYETSDDDPRVLVGAEALLRGRTLGLHVAVEHADLSDFGALYAAHIDGIWR